MKNIYLPHLHYTILYGIATGSKMEMLKNKNWEMMTETIDSNTSAIYYKKKLVMTDMPTIAHEAMHALQNMSVARSINMTYEEEHSAYCLQHIINEIFGLKYKPTA